MQGVKTPCILSIVIRRMVKMEINTVMKETIYSILQEPTREKFVEYLLNGGGEQDNVDFKEKMIDHQKLSEVILGIANTGGGVIIFGIKENDDGTIEAVGLEQLEDKEKVTSKLQKYLPEALHINVIKKCLSPAKKYKLYKSSINKSLHFAQRRLSSSTRGQRVTAQLNLSRE